MSGPRVLSLSINEEGSLFSACTDSAVTIYNMEPLVSKLKIPSTEVGTISLCKLLHRTNLIALVAGGSRPKYAENTVLIWDAARKEFVLEFTLATRVLSLRTRRDRLFVVERTRIHCFSFPQNPHKLFTIETGDNPAGLCEVTPFTSAAELQLVAYPGHRVGSVQLLDLSSTSVHPQPNLSDLSMDDGASSEDGSSPNAAPSVSISPTSVSAHQSEIACIALNRSGTLLATASGKGTLIRIFRTIDLSGGRGGGSGSASSYIPLCPEKIAEYRRGMDTATLYCIVFSPDSEYVLASSDKGTVHIFALSEGRNSRRSTLAPLVNLNGEYSLSKFTLPAECACACAFGGDRQSVYAICVDGGFHKYLLTKEGNCERDNFDSFLEAHDESEQILL